MSRETSINVNVNSGKSIATISKLKEAFEELKVAKDSVASDGKIKLAIDFKDADRVNLDAMSKAIGRLGTVMKNVGIKLRIKMKVSFYKMHSKYLQQFHLLQ